MGGCQSLQVSLGCIDHQLENAEGKYQNKDAFAAALRRRDSFRFFTEAREAKGFAPGSPMASSAGGKKDAVSERRFHDALARLHAMFLDGAPDLAGQLDRVGFTRIFGLKPDIFCDRLVKIFDLDNSGEIGFREFVYGLSKFQVDTFERRIQFAYRLIDLDGDGSLDKFELLSAVKAVLDSDHSQYKPKPRSQIKLAFRARPSTYNPIIPGNPKELQREVELMARNMGATKRMGFSEFQLLVSRFPQMFVPAEYLYRLLNVNSKDAGVVVAGIKEHGMTKLLAHLGRFNVDGDTAASGFLDRSEKGPKYRFTAARFDDVEDGDPVMNMDAPSDATDGPPSGGSNASSSGNNTGRRNGVRRNKYAAGEDDGDDRDGDGDGDRDRNARRARLRSVSGKHWGCSVCTLLNPMAKSVCAACGMARADVVVANANERGERAGRERGMTTPPKKKASSSSAGSLADGVAADSPPPSRSRSGGDLRDSNGTGTSGGGGAGNSALALRKSTSRLNQKTREFLEWRRASGPRNRCTDEIKTFMLDIGLSNHVETLSEAEVTTVADLALMSDADMKEIGLPKGPRLRIVDALKHGFGRGGLGGHGGGGFTCKICMEAPVESVLKPCGHSLMCWRCAQNVKQCPVCRRGIDETVRMFVSW